jgi:hypothetical protein
MDAALEVVHQIVDGAPFALVLDPATGGADAGAVDAEHVADPLHRPAIGDVRQIHGQPARAGRAGVHPTPTGHLRRMGAGARRDQMNGQPGLDLILLGDRHLVFLQHETSPSHQLSTPAS